MFIQTESTPNPRTLKFVPGRDVSPDGARDYAVAVDATDSPLALSIFAIDGVERVFLGRDFVAVTRTEASEWAHLKPFILAAIMDLFVSGLPAVEDGGARASAATVAEPTYEGEAAEIVEQLKELIETRVRPAVAQDGGDIVFDSWDHATGIVRLHMRGACSGCPSSTYTLKQGIETMLKHYVPEVRAVEQIV